MIIKKIYISDDGVEFLKEEDCKKYEEQNSYKDFFKHYGSKIRFYGREGQFIKKEELSEFDLDYLDYVYLEDDTLAEITASYIEKDIPSPFQQFGCVVGYFWWDSDNEEWHDFASEYNNLIEKNKTGFDIKYLVDLRKED